MQALKKAMIGTAAVGALVAVMGATPAAATPAYTINPAYLGATGLGTPTETDLTIASDSTIYQTGAGTQTENGLAWGTAEGFNNAGNPSSSGLGGEVIPGNYYGLYFTYTANVSGLTGFAPGQSGTVTSFNYTLYADIGDNDIITPGTYGATPTNPTITDTGGNDEVLAMGTLIYGSAGFESDGTPFFSAATNFILCDGTAGQGILNGATVAASACEAGVDGADFFTNPNPFYSIAFIGTTPSGPNDIGTDGTNLNATLNGIGGDVSFAVPEPLTLSLFGAGLAGVAGLRRRRRSKKA